jgi:hypothetical protein
LALRRQRWHSCGKFGNGRVESYVHVTLFVMAPLFSLATNKHVSLYPNMCLFGHATTHLSPTRSFICYMSGHVCISDPALDPQPIM